MTRHSGDDARPKPSLVSRIVARAEARVLSTVMMSVSGAIGLVALSYAVYAQLSTLLSPAASAALTALAFAALAFVFGLAGPALIRARVDKAEAEAHASRAAKLAAMTEIGAVAVGVAIKAAMIHRHRRRH